MIYSSSSSFQFTKTKNAARDRKPAGRHRFRDISPAKLVDLIRSLHHRCLRRNAFHRSPTLTRSHTFPLPLANHGTSHTHASFHPPPISKSPSLRISHNRSSARSISDITQENRSAGMSTSSPDIKTGLVDVARGYHSVPAFPTTPSTFLLRPASRKDYQVGQLEQHLSRLNLGDASPDHLSSSPRDIPMEVCLPSEADGGRKPVSLSHSQIPMILVTSVDSVHAKPLPPSNERPPITLFGPSNLINHATNVSFTKFNKKVPTDDPFETQPHAATYPPDYNLTFRLPPFPLAHSVPYAPETPTPMCCDHLGDCNGDLWDIWHPPLVASRFSLPPFKFPPLNTDLFDGVSAGIPGA